MDMHPFHPPISVTVHLFWLALYAASCHVPMLHAVSLYPNSTHITNISNAVVVHPACHPRGRLSPHKVPRLAKKVRHSSRTDEISIWLQCNHKNMAVCILSTSWLPCPDTSPTPDLELPRAWLRDRFALRNNQTIQKIKKTTYNKNGLHSIFSLGRLFSWYP